MKMNQWRKGIASWKVGKTLYLSVPFTWLMGEAESMAKAHKGKVVAGGPAVKLMGAPWADTPNIVPFDTLAFHSLHLPLEDAQTNAPSVLFRE